MEWHDRFDVAIMDMVNVARDFLQNEVDPVIDELERKAEYPEEIFRKMVELGWMGVNIPEEYGGSGLPPLYDIVLSREISYTSPGLHLVRIANSSLTVKPILIGGSYAQKRKLLPLIVRGERRGCFGLSEVDAGSDARAIKTHARKVGNQWVIIGGKTWITNAWKANLMIFFAKGDNGEIHAFILDAGDDVLNAYPGVRVTKIPKHALKVSDFCEVELDNVVLPASALLGQEGKGFDIAKGTLFEGRKNIGAQAVGGAAWIFDEALRYVKMREQFGEPLWNKQAVRHDFALWYQQLRAAWNSVVDSANIIDYRGESPMILSSCAKDFATTTALQVAMGAVQKFGAVAFVDKPEIPLWLPRISDIIAACVYEGTNPLQKDIIANELDKVYS